MTILEMSPLELVASFVLTWVIGLAPAVVARYVIYKQPLSRKAANWIAGISSVIFYLIFRLINAANGDSHPGDGVVWGIVFLVARRIMNRGRNEMLAAKLDEMANDNTRTQEERDLAKTKLGQLKK